MIHIFLGTKAQLIKMAPIMRELQTRGIHYNFIFSGQHQETIEDLRNNFGIKAPDITLYRGQDITSVPTMIFWSIKLIWFTLRNKNKIWKNDKNGIVLNHGDTFSTLLGSILAKICGLKAAHIESGLRSFNILNPFPEELTRLIVFRLSDYYFTPDEWSLSNLRTHKGIMVNTQGNTLYDSLQLISAVIKPTDVRIPSDKYAIVSLHRFENLYKKDHLIDIIQLLETISERMPLLFILHNPTKKKLQAFNLLERLQNNPNIETRPRYDYLRFIELVSKSEFVITDGGSNQEECYYLGKPCLLFRNATERQEGIGENTVLSKFETNTIIEFVENYQQYERQTHTISTNPSSIIVNKLADFY